MRYMVATEEEGDRILYMKDSHRNNRRLAWTMQPELFSRRLRNMAIDHIQRHLCVPGSLTMRLNW